VGGGSGSPRPSIFLLPGNTHFCEINFESHATYDAVRDKRYFQERYWNALFRSKLWQHRSFLLLGSRKKREKTKEVVLGHVETGLQLFHTFAADFVCMQRPSAQLLCEGRVAVG